MPSAYDSDLAKKLNVKSGMRVRIVGRPDAVDLPGLDATDAPDAEAVLVFVRRLAEVDALSDPALDAAARGGVVWLAYPKARQLETDLNRDILWRHMTGRGVQAVRQVSIDETWSAIRFRPDD